MKLNKYHKRRLYIISLFACGIALACGLILYALRQNINVFLTPTQLAVAQPAPDYHCRLGGMVKKASLVRATNSLQIQFIVTDLQKEIIVHYDGILPDLFREGKGVIADGFLAKDGSFHATQILAKHDENYMPRNLKYIKQANT